MVIFGVHVHVGLASADKAMPIVTSMLTWFPHLQALSASSPFWEGRDTDYASNRALLSQQLPTAGLPFHFWQWSEYEGYVEDLTRTGVIDGPADIRWDVRPSPALGTVEVRVCDGVPSLTELAALTALTQCLVVDLDRRLDNGETLPMMPPWHVQENKWRAARYGLGAEIILDAAGRERLVTDDLDDLFERLTPVARRLECEDELRAVSEYPHLELDVERVIADGDLVVTHSHLVLEPGRPGRALADYFRLENGKVVEHWDVVQDIPETAANANGMSRDQSRRGHVVAAARSGPARPRLRAGATASPVRG